MIEYFVIFVKRFFICSLTWNNDSSRWNVHSFLTVAMLVFASDIQCGSEKVSCWFSANMSIKVRRQEERDSSNSCRENEALSDIFTWNILRHNCFMFNILWLKVPSVLWRCWLGGRKGIRPVKNWVVGCWRGYLSGARCRLAYGPADATATHCLLLQ